MDQMPATTAPTETVAPPPGGRVKPPVPASTLAHRDLLEGRFWQHIPAWADVDEATFLDYRWQGRNSVTRIDKLLEVVRDIADPAFIADAEAGFAQAPMSVRITPYLLALVDWRDPYRDPIRRQFIPIGSQMLADHPELTLDSLGEQSDMPVLGLTHRYPDKALFLALDTCPVYCRFCWASRTLTGVSSLCNTAEASTSSIISWYNGRHSSASCRARSSQGMSTLDPHDSHST